MEVSPSADLRPPASRLRRRLLREGGVLGLYLFLALAMLSPLASDTLPGSSAQDLANHVSGVVEAGNALGERQFPVRVAPRQVGGRRYPIFQFYGNLPYTAAGLVHRGLRVNPYRAWKVVVTLALVLGAFFVYRGGCVLCRRPLPAAAGAAFLTHPDLLYYPAGVEVRGIRRPVPCIHLGQLVAVELAVGPHRLRWANRPSAAWSVVQFGLLVRLPEARRRVVSKRPVGSPAGADIPRGW